MLAFYPSCRRRFNRRSLTDDQMGLHDRELSPLSSNDIGDKMYRSKGNDMPNHFNKTMKRSVTDTIRDQTDGDSEMPIMSIQKPAYIPGKLSWGKQWNSFYKLFLFTIQLNVLTRPTIKSPSWVRNIKTAKAITTNQSHQHPAKALRSSSIPRT